MLSHRDAMHKDRHSRTKHRRAKIHDAQRYNLTGAPLTQGPLHSRHAKAVRTDGKIGSPIGITVTDHENTHTAAHVAVDRTFVEVMVSPTDINPVLANAADRGAMRYPVLHGAQV